MTETKKAFNEMGIEWFDNAWDSVYPISGRQKQINPGEVTTVGSERFRTQMTQYLSSLPEGTEVFLIGHSFGGDSILHFLDNYQNFRTGGKGAVKIRLAAVIDPVGYAGTRANAVSNTVGSNVEYFFNRWQTNNVPPIDFVNNVGRVANCKATVCDEKEHSTARNSDGTARKVNCGKLEVGCKGARWITQGINSRYDPGRKNEPRRHNDMPTDDFIEAQISEIVGKLVKESSPETVSVRKDVPPGVPNLMIQTEGYPVVAVFSERKESFAIGCMKVRNIWEKIPVQVVSSSMYNNVQATNPVVADLPCDGSIRAYAPTGEPGALVIKHRNGVYYRHYINPLDFIGAVKAGDLIPIDVSEFRTTFPERGTDFQVYR